MAEPRRWLDPKSTTSPEVRELLEAGHKPEPMTASERARSAEQIASLAATPPAVPLWGSLLQAKGLKVLLVIGTLTGLGILAALLGQEENEHSPAPPIPPTPPTQQEAPPTPSCTELPTDVHAPPALPSAPGAKETAAPLVPRAPRALDAGMRGARPKAIHTPQDTEENANEAALLDEARSLRAADPHRALDLLTQHAQRFPRGKLGLDRELLTIDALHHAGLDGEARSRARALLERSKGKPWEEKIRRIVENMH